MDGAEESNMALDFAYENLDLEEYQTEWKRANFRMIKRKDYMNFNNQERIKNYEEKVKLKIEEDLEMMEDILENMVMNRTFRNFIMSRIYKSVLDIEQYFGDDKKGFLQWKKDLLSLKGLPLSARMLQHYSEIYRLVTEYKWAMYYPYSPLLQLIINAGGLDKVRNHFEEIVISKGEIHVKSLQWNWNQWPSYFLNIPRKEMFKSKSKDEHSY